MSDLKYTVEVTGLKDVEQLEKNLDRLHKTLNAGQGSGKSLEEMRKILVGMRGQASIISDLRDSIKGLNTAADQLSKSFDSGFKQLDRTFKQGFQLVLDRVNMFGAEYGSALGTQLSKGMESAGQAAKVSGEKLAGELKNIRKKLADSSTAAYEGLVSGNPLQKLNENTAKELVELQAHGARLSSFHKTVVDEYKKYGTLYTQEMSAFEVEKQRARDKELKAERTFNAELSKIQADRQAARRKELEDAVRASVRTAINAPSGTYQVYNPTTGLGGQIREVSELSKVQEKATKTSGSLSNALRILTVDGNDTHSAMRGLASGFNLLWLTWGKLAPLFAGAGISYTLTRAFSVGSEVEYQIRFMEELGHTADATGKRIEGAGGVIRQELRKLNEESMYSIVELSKAMTDLGQTNYSVAESLQILRPATALATAGLVDLDTATKTLIQVNALFGRTAEDTGRTAAQLFHITKSSVLNVEDLAGAFKYASEVNTKFHGSLEESLVLFSALSKAGIKGQAAGTAMINMYRDIYGRSGPAIKALEGLRKATGDTIKTFDEFGKRRSILDIFEDIHNAASKLPIEMADQFLSKLYSARGGRTHFALARDDMEKLRKEFEELKKVKPEELFKAAEGLMDTTKGAAEILKSTMTNTLDEVFEAYEKGFKDFIVALTAGIRSDEFKETLYQITAAAQGLFNVVKDNFDLISTFGKLLLGWGALKFTVSALAGLASAITGVAGVITLANGGMIGMNASVAANTAATGLNITAQKTSAQAHYQNMVAKALMTKGYDAETARAAAATAATNVYTGAVTRANFVTRGFAATMAFLTGPIGLVVTALGILASLYYSTKSAAENAAAGMSEASDKYTSRSLANISKEIRAITARNMLLNQQDEFSEAEAEIRKKSAAFAKAVEGYEAQRAKFANAVPGAAMKHFDAKALERLQEQEKELNMLWGELYEARRISAEAREKREAEAAQKAAAAAKKAAEDLEKLINPKTTPDFNGGGNGFVDLNRDKELQALKAHYDAELAVANDYYNKSKQLLDNHRSANLISEEEYMVQSLQLTRSHEAEQLQVLEASLAAYTEASERRRAALESQLSGANGKGKNMLLDQLKKETQEFEIFVTNYEKERAKITAESYARVGEVVLKLQTEVGKLLKSSEDFWDNVAVSSAAQKEADELARKYKNMNTSILSMDSAMYEFEKAQKSTQAEIKKMNAALEKQLSIQKSLLQVELLSLQAAQASGKLTMDELIQRVTLISQLKEGIEKLKGDIANNLEKGLELGAERGWEAFQKMREKQVQELANSMSEAITDGLMSGDYKSIGKSIRDILQRELIRKPLQAWIQAAVGSVLGGSSAQASSGTGQWQGLGNLFSGNSGLTLGTSVGNWLSDTGFNMASGANLGTISNSLGNSMLDLGNTITQWDSTLQAIPGFEGGFGSVFAYGKAIFDIFEGNYGSGVGTAAGAYIGSIVPGIGTAIGAFLGGTLGGLFDGGSPYYGGDAVSVGGAASWTGKMGGGYNSGIGNYFGSYAQGISAALTGILKDEVRVKIGFDENEKRARAYLDLHDTAGSIAVSRSGVSVAKGEEGVKETINLVAKEAFSALLADDRLTTYEKQLVAAASAAGTTYENLISAYTQINAVNTAFAGLATTMTMFVGISDDMKAALLNGLGGIEGLSQTAQAYYQNFYSEEERLKKAGESVNATLAAMGIQLDVFGGEAAKIQYRSLVEKAFADGNQELAAKLLQMSGAFAEVANAAEQSTTALREAERAAAEQSTTALREAERAAADKEHSKRVSATDEALRVLERAINLQKKQLNEQLKAAQETVNLFKRLSDTLSDAVKKLRGQVEQTYKMQVAEARRVIDVAKITGVMPDPERLAEAVGVLAGSVEQGLYATQYDKSKAFLTLANDFGYLKGKVDPQLAAAETSVKRIETQIEQLDLVLENARRQVDELRKANEGLLGIDSNITNVDAAVKQLETALQAEAHTKAIVDAINNIKITVQNPAASAPSFSYGGGGSSSSGSGSPSWSDAIASVVGQGAGPQGALYASMVNSGMSHAQIVSTVAGAGYTPSDADWAAIQQAAGIRSRAVGGYTPPGLTLVGEEGPEIVNFKSPGMVYTTAQSTNLLGSDNSELIEEIRALREEVFMLRAEARATAVNTGKSARILDDVTQGGDTLTVTVAA